MRASCLMPTCNRRLFVPFAVEDFLRQDHPDLELIVLDDGAEPVADLIPADPRIRYIRLDRRHTVGAKRNIGCEEARGDIIVHWDDDDWAAPWRVRHQVAALTAAGADLCGLDTVLFYEPAADRAWEYVYPRGGRPWVYGATLCYTKAFWRRSPFPEVSIGEDTRFVWADRAQRILALPDSGFYVGVIHSGNTSSKQTGDSRWRTVDESLVRARLGDRREKYREVVRAGVQRAVSRGDERPPGARGGASVSRISVGICVHAEPERLRATVAAVRATTTSDVDLVLLPDGPDDDVRAALEQFGDLPQLATDAPLGAAACFNRLAARGADVSVLLESGAEPGPRWLDHLLAALAQDPRNALAGPTTNRSWNEQAAVPARGRGPNDSIATALETERRFAGQVQLLEPLHSLADFCYAVRRDVIDAIGLADEGYGLGPCWEMDYNIRAARAGFRGVWARAAYVYRSPFTARRHTEEALRFQSSRHRYQDKFCGARLQGRRHDYRPHCLGDACPDFAPASLIPIRLFAPAGPNGSSVVQPSDVPQGAASTRSDQPSFAGGHREPLATCVITTSGRHAALRQAIRCFLRQDYSNLELVVVNDGAASVDDCLPEDARCRCVRVERQATQRSRWRAAIAQSRGDVIVHWDANVWYAPSRVRTQVGALVEEGAGICGSSRILCYEPLTDQSWERIMATSLSHGLHVGTLAYWRHYGERMGDVTDDGLFICGTSGDAIVDFGDRLLWIAVLQPGASTADDSGRSPRHARPSAGLHSRLGDDVHFYRTMQMDASASGPMVSCIMPTHNRRALMPLAIQLFQQQDYPRRELIIVDDGDDAVEDVVPPASDIRYFRLPSRRRIGAKRNFACQQARGDIIAHWDDDDWYASERLRYQIAPLLAGQADLTGLHNAFVLEPASGQFWTIDDDLHRRMFVGDVHGGTLVFWKRLFIDGVQYPEIDLAEDASLLQSALRRGKRLLRLSNPGMFVYMRHGRNAWTQCLPGRFLNPAGWRRIARPPSVPGSVLSSYHAAAVGTGSPATASRA